MNFKVHKVSDKEELAEIYRLRYKVYCEEWGFEKPEDHHGGLETDIYDKHSVHFAAEDNNGKIIGTIRLILNSPDGFPLEKHCPVNIDKNGLPRDTLSEISRLVISKDYRKRTEDNYIYGTDEERRSIGSFNYTGKTYYRRAEDRYRYGLQRNSSIKTKMSPQTFQDRRRRHEVVLNLYRSIYHESKNRQVTHWYAIMTKGLYILLRRLGIYFLAIGDPVDYHGIRTPYLGDTKKIEHEVMIKNPELYNEFTEALRF
jgi:N-acyl-L-homoserine lactone synthetase